MGDPGVELAILPSGQGNCNKHSSHLKVGTGAGTLELHVLLMKAVHVTLKKKKKKEYWLPANS